MAKVIKKELEKTDVPNILHRCGTTYLRHQAEVMRRLGFEKLDIHEGKSIGLLGGARGVMVIVVGNGHGDTISNPGRDSLHFT